MKFQNGARVCTHNLLYLLQAKAKFHPSEKSDFPFKLYAREEMTRVEEVSGCFTINHWCRRCYTGIRSDTIQPQNTFFCYVSCPRTNLFHCRIVVVSWAFDCVVIWTGYDASMSDDDARRGASDLCKGPLANCSSDIFWSWLEKSQVFRFRKTRQDTDAAKLVDASVSIGRYRIGIEGVYRTTPKAIVIQKTVLICVWGTIIGWVVETLILTCNIVVLPLAKPVQLHLYVHWQINFGCF